MTGSFRSLGIVLALALLATSARAAGLTGSPASMVHQHAVALREDYSFLRTATDVQRLADRGALIPVVPNADVALSGVSFAFARPEVAAFVRQFAESYHEATGEQLVVTSLTRPETTQPGNAHALSVHPAGMAVDLRIPTDSAARGFIERTLLAMERQGLLDATREHRPAHYHIAVFAEQYAPYAARLDSVAKAEHARREAQRRAAVDRALTAVSAARARDDDGDRLTLAGVVLLAGLAAPLGFVRRRARRAAHPMVTQDRTAER